MDAIAKEKKNEKCVTRRAAKKMDSAAFSPGARGLLVSQVPVKP